MPVDIWSGAANSIEYKAGIASDGVYAVPSFYATIFAPNAATTADDDAIVAVPPWAHYVKYGGSSSFLVKYETSPARAEGADVIAAITALQTASKTGLPTDIAPVDNATVNPSGHCLITEVSGETKKVSYIRIRGLGSDAYVSVSFYSAGYRN